MRMSKLHLWLQDFDSARQQQWAARRLPRRTLQMGPWVWVEIYIITLFISWTHKSCDCGAPAKRARCYSRLLIDLHSGWAGEISLSLSVRCTDPFVGWLGYIIYNKSEAASRVTSLHHLSLSYGAAFCASHRPRAHFFATLRAANSAPERQCDCHDRFLVLKGG